MATVTGTGDYSSSVTWSASAGTINSSGLFTAPATAGTVTVTATSVQDTSKIGNTLVTITAPVASLSPTSLGFGSQSVGVTSASQTVTLSNTGNATLSITSVATSASFGQTNNCGGSVAAGGSCTANVTFSPTTAGPLTGTLTITDNSNAVLGSTQTVSLSGTGTAPAASLSPTSLSFGSEPIGTTSAARTVTLSNTGNPTLSITSIATSANFGQTNNCGGSVPAGGSCTVNVTFSPTTAGPLTGTLTITDNNNAVAGSTQTVSLSGTGTAPTASLSPTSLSFGSEPIGTTSAAQTVTLTNTGNATLNISSLGVTGTNAGDFVQTNTCASSLAASANCTIAVMFTPSNSGSRTAALSVSDNATGSPQTVSLSGTGIVPVAITGVSITPPSTTLNSGATQQFSAVVSGTGNYDTTVSWYVCDSSGGNCVLGGNSSYGTVSTTGLYTAPVLQVGNQALIVTVEAIANGNSNESASAAVVVNAVFSNASLNGQYAFSLQDPEDVSSLVGSFTADGNGDVTQGILDINDGTVATGITFTGSYLITADGRGELELVLPGSAQTPPVPPQQYNFVMLSSNEGRIVSVGIAQVVSLGVEGVSGVLLKQDPSAFSNAALIGNYSFLYSGSSTSLGIGGSTLIYPNYVVGMFISDGQGHITAGTEDTINWPTVNSNLAVNGSYSIIGSNGRGAITLTSSLGSSNFSFYVVSASKILFTSIDESLPFNGEAEQQSGYPFSNASLLGNYTFSYSGFETASQTGPAPGIPGAGLFSTDGNGVITSEEDILNYSGSPGGGGSYSVSSNGRGTASWTNEEGTFNFVFYLISSSKALFIQSGGAEVNIGEVDAQESGPFNTRSVIGNYGFSVSAPYGFSGNGGSTTLVGLLSVDGNGNVLSMTEDIPGVGTVTSTGTYTYGVSSNGWGQIWGQLGTTPVNGMFAFDFWIVSPSQIILLGANENALGSAAQQGSSASQ